MSVHRKYISKVQPTRCNFFRSIYFYKLLYMFQAVPPLIIKSTKLYKQHQVLSNQYCCLGQQTTAEKMENIHQNIRCRIEIQA